MVRRFSLATTLVLIAALLGACNTLGRKPPVHPGGMTIRTEVDPLVGLATYTDEDLLRLAEEAFAQRLYERAYLLYQRCLDEFPDVPQRRAVQYNADLAAEKTDRWIEAIALFEALLAAPESDDERISFRFHLVECTAHAARWADARDHIQWLLRRADTSAVDRFELLVTRAWVVANEGEHDKARAELERLTGQYRYDRGRTYNARQGAKAWYHLGEVHRLMAEQSPLVHVDDPVQARKELNDKAIQILAAQEAYLQTIRIGDREWIPKAGWRLGGLYEQFRNDILRSPFPEDVQSDQDGEIYREILQEQTAVLLMKARTVYQKVLAKAAEVSMHDEWVVRIHEALEELQRELEEQGLAADI